jgi:hypothetical protein
LKAKHRLKWTCLLLCAGVPWAACAYSTTTSPEDVAEGRADVSGALPPLPIATDAQALLRRAASNVVDSFDFDAGTYPDTGFGYLHPANHTLDLRIRTENCDQAGGGNVPGVANVCIFATTPEALTAPLSQATITPMTRPFVVTPPTMTGVAEGCAGDSGVECNDFARGNRFICDAPAGQTNPHACDADGGTTAADHDCYDIVHVGVLLQGQLPADAGAAVDWCNRLVGTPLTVIVASPKTATAKVSSVVVGTPVLGPNFDPAYSIPTLAGARCGGTDSSNVLFTPSVSGDGKLLVVSAPAGLMYAYSSNPCDVTGWTNFKPITEMYLDTGSGVNPAYGLARSPIRDGENNVLVATRNDAGVVTSAGLTTGGYMWMDTKANNLFFNYARGNSPWYWSPDAGQVEQRYPVSAIDGGADGSPTPAQILACGTDAGCFNADMDVVADPSTHGGLAFYGLWTNGKVVVPDDRLNKNTLGIHSSPELTYAVDLYGGDAGTWTLMAADIRRKAGFQNAFEYLPDMRPDDPHDVVWKASTQQDTDEIYFDDLVTSQALIVSPMNASVTYLSPANRVNDGYAPTNDDWNAHGNATPHVQNTATSTVATPQPFTSSSWIVPRYGTLQGTARIEPLPAGGVRGAGIFLDGSSYLDYVVPAQDISLSGPWFYSAWFEPTALGGTQILFSVGSPSIATLAISGTSTLTVTAAGATPVSFSLSSDAGASLAFTDQVWTHVALWATPGTGSTEITVAVNGMTLGSASLSVTGAFTPVAAQSLDLGGATGTPFTGWVDDFRVLSRVPNPEELCRQAYGTLAGVSSSDADTAAWAHASAYPASSHAQISDVLTQFSTTLSAYGIDTWSKYICEARSPSTSPPISAYCVDSVRRPSGQPNPQRCVGAAVVFPEGPVVPHQRRPDSYNRPDDAGPNPFCLSCHSNDHPSFSLTPQAITPTFAADSGAPSYQMDDAGYFLSEWDPRRQPMQPTPRQYGVIPAGMFCDGSPGTTMTADAAGVSTDEMMVGCP